MPMEDHDREEGEAPDLLDVDAAADDEAPGPEGLGALGQLAVAVIVVGVLIVAFIGGSAILRRIFG